MATFRNSERLCAQSHSNSDNLSRTRAAPSQRGKREQQKGRPGVPMPASGLPASELPASVEAVGVAVSSLLGTLALPDGSMAYSRTVYGVPVVTPAEKSAPAGLKAPASAALISSWTKSFTGSVSLLTLNVAESALFSGSSAVSTGAPGGFVS